MWKLAAVCVAMALCACPTPPPPPPETHPRMLGGDAGTLSVSTDGRTIMLGRSGTTLLTLPPDAFELGTVLTRDPSYAADPYWLERRDVGLAVPPPEDLQFETVESAAVDGDVVTLRFPGGISTLLMIAENGPGRFRLTWKPAVIPDGVFVLWLRVKARVSTEERFYGLGGWPDSVEHRGMLRPVQMEADLSVESANNELHVPVPFLVGTGGWGVFVESRRMGLFDVARKEPDLVEMTWATDDAGTEGLALHLFVSEHPLDVTRHLYAVTGAPLVPGNWAYGPLIWRDENRDQAQFLDDARRIRALDLATSGMWIDRPYARAVNTFDFDPARFPSPRAMIDEAHGLGLRVALWHTPYLEPSAQPLVSEATDAGFFPPHPGTLLNHWSDPVDFTDEEAFAWWQQHVRNYTDMGIEGFKLDYAEDVLPSLYGSRNEWLFHDGSDERTMHHGYTVLYHRAYAGTLVPGESFLLCRAARWGDQANVSVIWPGDLDATFTKHREVFTPRGSDSEVTGVGGLPASVVMALNLGVVGFPFFGADTGGYRHSPPDNELFIRWFEQTALSSVMQVGDSSSQPPWEFTTENGRTEETLALYRQYARLHLRLLPYWRTHALRLVDTGHPIMRPVGLQFPSLGEHPGDEYMFGDDLLVAPVMERGATSRSVVFPPGRWLNWWTGEVVDGGTRRMVDAPLETIPLFAREGAIIPMLRDTIDTAAPTTEQGVESFADDPGVLTLRIVPAAARNSFTVFDGTVVTTEGNTAQFSEGSVFTRGYVLEVMGPGGVMTVPVPPGNGAATW